MSHHGFNKSTGTSTPQNAQILNVMELNEIEVIEPIAKLCKEKLQNNGFCLNYLYSINQTNRTQGRVNMA